MDALTHELLDRINVASQYMDEALGEHPSVVNQPKWAAAVDDIVDKLEALYQAIRDSE